MSNASSTPSAIRIAIVEDNAYLRAGWEVILDNVRDFVVQANHGSAEDALADADLHRADVVLMDIGLPGISGIECLAQLTERYPRLSIIMITVHDDDQHVFEAMCAGAVGYLLKHIEPIELINAIRVAHAGGSPMTPNIARKVIESFRRGRRARRNIEVEALTDREQEILEWLSQGTSYATIAEQLYLSIDGVRYHIRHIYEKLHVHSRAEAVAKGLKHRLIHPRW